MESKDFLPHNEENGKRNKFWIANNTFMFKQSKIDTYEMYSELFADELANLIGLKVASYFPAKYETNGLLTLNFLENNETLISGNQIIHWFLLNYSKNCNYKSHFDYDFDIYHPKEEIQKRFGYLLNYSYY